MTTSQQQRRPQQQQRQQTQAPAQTTAITTKRPPISKDEIAKLETALAEVGDSFGESTGALSRSFAMARGLNLLNDLITEPMLDEIMVLMNSPLGFLTDKNTAGEPTYTREVVKRTVIEAAIRGARWVGNEFNIIAKRAYLTKEFFTRKVAEAHGLTDLKLKPGVPQLYPNGALVPFIATWKMDGAPCRLERIKGKTPEGDEHDGRIAVRVNQGMGADAILGKAERKMLAAIRKELIGSRHDPAEEADPDIVDAEVVSREPTPEDGKTAAETAQAAHEGPQEPAGGEESQVSERQPGDDSELPTDGELGQTSPPDDQYLSDLAIEMETALNAQGLTPEQNVAIKQDVIDKFAAGRLQQFEAEHLQHMVERNKERFSK